MAFNYLINMFNVCIYNTMYTIKQCLINWIYIDKTPSSKNVFRFYGKILFKWICINYCFKLSGLKKNHSVLTYSILPMNYLCLKYEMINNKYIDNHDGWSCVLRARACVYICGKLNGRILKTTYIIYNVYNI